MVQKCLHNHLIFFFPNRRRYGLTIIELLIVLAIISLMTGIGLLYINSDNFRLLSEVRNFRSMLVKAKGEAAKRNVGVSVYFLESSYQMRLTDSSAALISKTLPDTIKIVSKDSTPLTSEGYFNFTGIGTAKNHHIKIKNNDRNYSIKVNSVGRILIEGPF